MTASRPTEASREALRATGLAVHLLTGALVNRDWLGSEALKRACGLPGFARLAARAMQTGESAPHDQASPEPGHERWLAHWLGLPPECPIAACGPLADGQPDARWRIDPVHLHVGRDHLVLTDPAALALSEADAQALARAIEPLLADEGLALGMPVPNRWTLRETDAARPLRLKTRSLLGALGRNIDSRQPSGEDARRWRRLVNEVQMTWHEHPVNERRQSEGLLTVNSLWIEGPCPSAQPGAQSDAPLAQWQLAGRIALRGSAGATSTHRFEGCGPEGRRTLVIDDSLQQAAFSGDPQAWQQAWERLESSLFLPIAQGRSPWQAGVELVLCGDAGWRQLRILPPARWWSMQRFRQGITPDRLLAEPQGSRGSAT